jgi:hypothetical protein
MGRATSTYGISATLRLLAACVFIMGLNACAIDPVPTPADRGEDKNGGTIGLDVQTGSDTGYTPPGAGCVCTDDQGNEVWCQLDGDKADATCECDNEEPMHCAEGAEACEVVEPDSCGESYETCDPDPGPAPDAQNAD